ncbi:hypothetical protein EC973_005267 [Apophysomyces ossiformis]|uniref:Plasmid pRiA4b Orf3-like domain-containing protein n=1 Tax=Apophysomyces ossiformis TaxID=679940 RepID=A0A8H7BWM9_9FUNG|nr:hypothetical protein EC973_005267 [Apophysomyces ossiformis]
MPRRGVWVLTNPSPIEEAATKSVKKTTPKKISKVKQTTAKKPAEKAIDEAAETAKAERKAKREAAKAKREAAIEADRLQVRSKDPIYKLRVDLLYAKPQIWRRFLVPGSIKLSELHVALQYIMGWQFSHMHMFNFGDTAYGKVWEEFSTDSDTKDQSKTTLMEALGDANHFLYTYDMGDNWEHLVKVEKVLPPDPELRYPKCVSGRMACPPEDVGSIEGYESFLQIIKNPRHEEHQDMIDWVGGAFNPRWFDLAEVNACLEEIKL